MYSCSRNPVDSVTGDAAPPFVAADAQETANDKKKQQQSTEPIRHITTPQLYKKVHFCIGILYKIL